MYLLKFKRILLVILLLTNFFYFNTKLFAEVVDLPKIIEVPKLKRETLLRDIDIPSVRERDPDPQAGPRLSVSEFRLQGIVEYPELGITRAAISKIVEDIRFDMMGEGKLLESGHTIEELGQISNLLADIEKEVQQKHVGPLEVQRLVWLVREQQLKRGITLGMIETIADRITKYYRERGFILAKAYIPEQKVRDGVVTLTLLLGVLGEVKVNENNLYNDEIISSVFDGMLTHPVTSERVEEHLYLVNDLPGISTSGFFEAGSQVGDTRLNVNIKNEEYINTNLRVDNHGSEEAGQDRFYGEVLWNNPTGTADQLSLGVLYAGNPGNTTYGQLRYSTKFFSPRLKLSLGYANNAFVLGTETSDVAKALDLQGETNIIDFVASYQFKRSRIENYSFDFIYENIESLVLLNSLPNKGGGVLDDEVRNTSLVFNYDIIQESSKMVHQGNIRLTQGDFVLGAELGQDEDYFILKADYSLLSFWNIPFTNIETRSVVRSSLQLSESALSSINQFALGGPSRARGFTAKEFSADQALYAGVDWFFNTPEFLDFKMGDTSLSNVLTPFLFVDAVYGYKNTQLEEAKATTSTLINAGIGFQFSYPKNITGNIQVAFPIENNYSSPLGAGNREDDDDTRILFEFQYNF
ncbi:ShlB/FhaC/HecB family hemolysin secretion/activation protein [Aliikangiella sp. IMCC44359]|uniref:ShlB/FhaC/HecB family hemolysin secretion/activation protein n=1 Tax=Aliikangiella sp. IMCC44359 TaxID=3459125 RepID=UPI00403AE2C8